MAEIKIEKKKPVWPWIILVLIILAILYFLVFADDNDNDDTNNGENTEQVEDTTIWENERDTTGWDTQRNDTLASGGANSVSGYISYIGDESRMGIDHEYTNNALLRLLDAVEQKAKELNVDVQADLDEARQESENITKFPKATDHAGNIKNAGEKIANVLETIQQEKFPDLEQDLSQVRTNVEEIDPSVETLQQRDRINSFFEEAGDLLQKMS